MHHLHGRGVDRVTAEIAQEVGMHLQQPNADARPRKKDAEHQPRRTTADDEALCSVRLFHKGFAER